MVGLSIPIWWLTRTTGTWVGVLAVLVPTYATFHIASTVVDRYAQLGWSDGLEYFAYVISVGHTLVYAVAAAIGTLHWRRGRAP